MFSSLFFFIYSFDTTQPQKRKIAIGLIHSALDSGNRVISFQVAQEFINISTKKFETPFSVEEIREYYKKFLKPLLDVYPTEELYDEALQVMSTSNYSFYDSLIISGALLSEASVLYTEDLQHESKIGKLKIINPYI